MSILYENGKKYIMNFIDDYSIMCWVYLLKDRSEDFETFKIFHVWIQNEAQSHIVSLSTDNGREYTSNEFEIYLFQYGIKHQTKVPYNPRQNSCWQIQLTDNECLSLMATVKMTGKQKTSSER
jgi:transposase InsO family protein